MSSHFRHCQVDEKLVDRLLRNSWVHKFACFEVNEAQAESLCAVTEVAERPGAMLGLIGLDSRIGVVDVTS